MYVSFCPVRRSPSGFRPWGCPLPQTVPGGRRPAPMPGRRRGLRCRWAGLWTAHPSWDPSARANEPRPKPSVHLFFEHRSELEHLFLKHRAAKHSSYLFFLFCATHICVRMAPGSREKNIQDRTTRILVSALVKGSSADLQCQFSFSWGKGASQWYEVFLYFISVMEDVQG